MGYAHLYKFLAVPRQYIICIRHYWEIGLKTIIIDDEGWFKKANMQDIRMLGIRGLGIPAESMMSKQSEHFKRSLVRQMFVQKYDYGQVVKIEEISNPFGQPKRKRSKTTATILKGGYVFVKNTLRAPVGDIRHEMMAVIQEKSTFEDAIAEFDRRYGVNTKFKSTGKSMFDFNGFVGWALKCGWINRRDEDGT